MGYKLHLTCPKCHYDFEYNDGYVDRKIEELKGDINSIDTQLQKYKADYPATYHIDAWYKRAKYARAQKIEQLQDFKHYRKVALQQRDVQIYYTLKARLKKEMGEEKYLALMNELEEEMRYNVADMAKQSHTSFEGA